MLTLVANSYSRVDCPELGQDTARWEDKSALLDASNEFATSVNVGSEPPSVVPAGTARHHERPDVRRGAIVTDEGASARGALLVSARGLTVAAEAAGRGRPPGRCSTRAAPSCGRRAGPSE